MYYLMIIVHKYTVTGERERERDTHTHTHTHGQIDIDRKREYWREIETENLDFNVLLTAQGHLKT